MSIFAGKAALIYGGGKGIGRAVAQEFTRRGARVAVADINLEVAKETAALIGGGAVALKCDVLSDTSVTETAAAAETAFGDIDIVLNNVGGMLNGHPEDIPMAEWQRMMEINYFAAVRGYMPFLPKMKARGSGYIVNTASVAGLYPFADSRIPYAAAKAATISMTQTLAIHLKPLGISVSCFIPGPVMTGVLDSMTSWTPDAPMRGPGVELGLKLVDEVATTLADGMEEDRVLIPTNDEAWDMIKRWAADPDAFLDSKIDEFSRGVSGRPHISDDMRKMIEAM